MSDTFVSGSTRRFIAARFEATTMSATDLEPVQPTSERLTSFAESGSSPSMEKSQPQSE